MLSLGMHIFTKAIFYQHNKIIKKRWIFYLNQVLNIHIVCIPQYTSYYYLLDNTTDVYRQNYINNAMILLDKLYTYEDYREDSLLLRGMLLKENNDFSGAVGVFEQINDSELIGPCFSIIKV